MEISIHYDVCCIFQPAPNKRDKIASKARSYIGSMKWLKDSHHSFLAGAGDNKCNIFVADVLKEVDADAPNRYRCMAFKCHYIDLCHLSYFQTN